MAHSKPFDDETCSEITISLMRVLTAFDADGNAAEMREALIKTLAAVVVAPVLGGTDIDVFNVSLRLRESIYRALMQARRALVRDIGKEALDA